MVQGVRAPLGASAGQCFGSASSVIGAVPVVNRRILRASRSSTPEDELLLQFQGIIAEYERAQILERSRRGKRYRARAGEVSVLSGAPFGYRFIRKTDQSTAYYQIDDEQAQIVQRVFDLYCVEGLSIGAIARRLNEQDIPTAKRRGRWKRSVIWGMLRNPRLQGASLFWQDRDCAAPANYTTDTDARRHRVS